MKRHLAPLLMLLTLSPIVFAAPPPNDLDRPKPTVADFAQEHPQVFNREDIEKLGIAYYPWINSEPEAQWDFVKREWRFRTRYKKHKLKTLYTVTATCLEKSWRVIVSTLGIGN